MSEPLLASDEKSFEKPTGKRLVSIDMLRGLVMVLMALDHVRIFFTNVRFSPLDLTQTNVPLFLTRWVTHFCAPSFIFLAGISAYLSLGRGKSKQELSRFLVTRGLWLVFLELTVVRFSWIFDPTYSFSFAGVLWAIGWSMVILAGLIYLPIRSRAALGIILIVGHNLFDNLRTEQLGGLGWVWAVLHEPTRLEILPGKQFSTTYPLIPWIGVMAAGYAFGTAFDRETSQRRKRFRRLGLSLILAFIVMRAINIYGDPDPWAVQSSFSRTLLSFVNCHKYPPSLLYLLMTLGTSILALDLFESKIARFLKPLALFGQVPLFFYLIHIPLIHLAAIFIALPKYGFEAIAFPYVRSRTLPADYGFDLPIVYDLWIIAIVVLYPLCNWFAQYKAKRRYWWLSYF